MSDNLEQKEKIEYQIDLLKGRIEGRTQWRWEGAGMPTGAVQSFQKWID
jgi:hypothetical protein